MSYQYDVQIPLPGGTTWFAVCHCLTTASVAEVVKTLLDHTTGQPIQVVPIAVHDPVAPVLSSESPPF